MAVSYGNIGSALNHLGRHEEALKIEERALDIRKAILGEKHPHVATSYHNVGNTLIHLDRCEEALKIQMHALELRKSIFGEKHLHMALSYKSIGVIYLKMNDPYSARSIFEKALAIYQSNFSYKLHPDTADLHKWIAGTYRKVGKHKEANFHTKEARRIESIRKNLDTWEICLPKIDNCLSIQKYDRAFQLIDKLKSPIKEMPEVLCVYLQAALLSSLPTIQKIKSELIKQAEDLFTKEDPERLIKLRIAVTMFYIDQKESQKAFDSAHPLSNLPSSVTFTYQLLDVLAFKENQQIVEETLPLDILYSYLCLKISLQQNKNPLRLKSTAEQLLKKLSTVIVQGHKVKEIEIFCNKILQGL